ncbi:hypothetical protein [Spiroplasma floricola]|uniref:Aminoglycoside phosphotransferase domain-containing protein n=1 Tax=Spiroplasma floricola 23-6 TaxID=1336749 RepID=A0A2K8SE87_9MOLU|nr:hypothetical protein [Spiroplasma floricola]AUB31774.1 hypothetical protein SFLOR_v1c07260 [Spiroplasma floricola 23-6]
MKNNGLSGKKLIKKGKWIIKEKNSNSKNLVEISNILNEKRFKYFSKFKDIDDFTYSYRYVKGITLEKVKAMPFESTMKIIKIISELQSLYIDSENNVIVHGDISPVNAIFNNKLLPKKLIDWDGSYFGSKYDDIGYICWLWVNFGDDKQEHSKYVLQIIAIFKYLGYKKIDVINVKNSILIRKFYSHKNK